MAEGRDPKNPQPDDAAQQPDGNGQPPFEGWRRPSADEASQSPNVAGGWRKPDGSPLEPAASEPPAGSASASDGGGTEPRPDSPDAAPTQTGGWYRPPDAQIEDLLGGVDETIAEAGAPSDGGSPDDSAQQPAPDTTQAQDAHDTQFQRPADDEATRADSASDAEDAGTLILDARTAQPVKRATGPIIEEPPRSTEHTPVPTDTPAEPMAAVTPDAATEPEPSPFEQAERKISVLRQRYQAGYLTREELQKELRNLMILDDEGHWWMLGLESNRWYYYDGRDWIPGTPPGHDKMVRGSAVRTETSLQQVIDPGATEGSPAPDIPLDEDDMPLPRL